jgi:hypothetical protein
MRASPESSRGSAGDDRRPSNLLNPRLDAPNSILIACDPQRRAAAIIARKFALRMGPAFVIAGAVGLGSVR